jgi:hypothetical protein
MILKLFQLILIILVVATLSISIIYGYDQSISYWYTVSWVIVLLIINWATSIIVVEPKDQPRGAPGSWVAVFPFISISIFIYSLVSILFVCLWWIAAINTQFFFTAQILTFSFFSTLVILGILARFFAAHGTKSIYSKEDFVSEIKKIRSLRTSEEDIKALKAISDYVSYQMHHPAKLDQEMLSKAFNTIKFIDDLSPSSREIKEALKILQSA